MARTLMICLSLLIPAASFVSMAVQVKNRAVPSTTRLELQRRDVLISGVTAGLLMLSSSPQASHANVGNNFIYDDRVGAERLTEPQQMRTGGKLDLNAAFVSEYKQLQGMYPHAAGMIASHGPYKTVKDIYKIPKISDNDKALFKKYEREFTVNPPGRSFKERINERVST